MLSLLPNLKSKSQTPCDSGVYVGCECQNVELDRNNVDYWTSWSYIILSLAVVITFIALYTQRINRFFYVFLVFAASNSFAVAIAAQILLETTDVFKQVDLPEDNTCPATIDEEKFKEIALSNTLVHILPMFGSLFILLSLSTSRIPGVFIGQPILLIVFALGLWFGISLIYNSIPSEGTVFFSKFERVYFQDDVGVMFSLPALYFLFVLVISFFVSSTRIPFLSKGVAKKLVGK